MEATLRFDLYSRRIALETTAAYVDGFSTRLIPIFDHIDDEASEEADRAWDSAMTSPMNENFDPGDYAEAVQAHGLEVYENLHFVRQQLLGLAVAGLYHLWERLLKQFLSKELRDWTFDGKTIQKLVASVDFSGVEELLAQFGFALRQQPYYADLSELRLVGNVVKHGDGKSCEELHTTVPRLFAGYDYRFDIFSKSDSLELEISDFSRYATAITDFWNTFPENLTFLPEV